MSSFTSFDDLHFSGLNEKQYGQCNLCQERVEIQDNTCIVCGNEIRQNNNNNNNNNNNGNGNNDGNNMQGMPFHFGANGINLNSLNPDGNLNNPNNGEQLQANRIIELLTSMGINFPNDVFNDGVGQSANSVSKNTYDKLAKFKIKNSIEEHCELRSDTFIVDGLPKTDMFSITLGAFGNGKLKHNVKYEAILAQPINAHEKSLINANEVQNKIVVCLRGKSSFAKKARLCESFGASGVLVVNTLNVWPFTMGDSTGEGKNLNIPTAMCKKNDGERLIEMLKQKKTIGITFNIPEAKDTTCGICLDNYGKGNEIVQLPCLHFFHDKCIAAWFKVNNSCPICRKEIWDDDEKNNEQQRRRNNHNMMTDSHVRIDDMYL